MTGAQVGPEFLEVLTAGLSSLGREVRSFGVAATPTTGVLIKTLNGVAGGIQISASHNPPQWNGLKLFFAGGEGGSERRG